MQLTRGQRLPLSALTGSTLRIGVALAGISVDISCFGLDAQDKLSDGGTREFPHWLRQARDHGIVR